MSVETKKINYAPIWSKVGHQNFVLSQNTFISPVLGEMKYNSTLNVPSWFNGTTEVSHLDTRLNQFLSPNANLSMASNRITNLASPIGANDGANKSYVDNIANSGRSWKELLLIPEQLDNTNNSISQALPLYFSNNLVINDTISITDGTTTNTFTFKASRSTTFEVTLGANRNDTMTNLVNAIQTDSTLWNAVLKTNLNSINTVDGYVVILYRRNQSTTSFTDRIYGTFNNSLNTSYINYNNKLDYVNETTLNIPSSDPTIKTFGIGKQQSDLITNETHAIRSTDTIFTWDDDSTTWQGTSGGSYTSNSPISLSGNVFSLNFAKGLELVSSNLELRLNSNSGLVKNLGAGINELSINVDNSTLELNSNTIRVKDLGITTAKLVDNSVTTVKINNSAVTLSKLANNSVDETKITTSVAGNGLIGGGGTALNVGAGTGITVNTDDISINFSTVSGKFNSDITGDGTTTSFTITHNKNTKYVLVQVYNQTTRELEDVAIERNVTDHLNKIDITFATAPINGLVYNVVIHY